MNNIDKRILENQILLMTAIKFISHNTTISEQMNKAIKETTSILEKDKYDQLEKHVGEVSDSVTAHTTGSDISLK